MYPILLALTLLLAVSAPPSAAQPFSDPGLGLGAQGGISHTVDAPTVPVVRLHSRYRLTGMAGVEIAIGTQSTDLTAGGEPFLNVTQGQLIGSFLLFFLYDHPVQPFVLAGGGYYYTSEKGLGANSDYRRIEHLFGFHAGAGVDVRVHRSVSLFLDARYTFLGLAEIPPIFSGNADFFSATAGFNVYF